MGINAIKHKITMSGDNMSGVTRPLDIFFIAILGDVHTFHGEVEVALVVELDELGVAIQLIEDEVGVIGLFGSRRLGGVATFEAEKSNRTVNIDSTRSGIGIVPFAIGIAAVGSRSGDIGRVVGLDVGSG